MNSLLASFRVRLTLVVLAVALLPVIVTGGLTLGMAQGYLRATAVARHQDRLDAIAAGIDLTLRGRLAQLESLALDPRVQAMDPSRLAPVLQEHLTRGTFFRSVAVLDAAGRLVAHGALGSSPAPRAWIGRSAGSLPDPLLGRVAGEVASVIGKRHPRTVLSPQGGGTARPLLFVVPVGAFTDPDVAVGVLAAEASLDSADIQEVLDAFPVRPGHAIALLDTDGRIVARRGDGLPPTATRLVVEPAPAMRPGAIITVTVTDGGRRTLVSLSAARVLGGAVAIASPEREAFGLVHTLGQDVLVIVLLTALVAVVAGVLVASTIARPIQALTDGIRRITDGIVAHRVDVGSADEIGQAARALNDLARTLQKRRLVAHTWTALDSRGAEPGSSGGQGPG